MILMPLDHTREFFTNVAANPLDPRHATFMLYLTRWMTHLCAPVFVFLAGTSIFLQQQHKKKRQLTKLLLTRGLWLILVELTLVHLVFSFNWQWNVQILEVIWAIGASMMVMAGLIHFSPRFILIVGLLLVCGHNALDGLSPAAFGALGWLWRLLHVPGPLTGMPLRPPIVFVAYPLLPWLGTMALGYAFGGVVLKPADQRLTWELRAAACLLALFFLLRWINVYGDPSPWIAQAAWWRTSLSFLNVQKYPPSLLFLCATLGISALVMAALEAAQAQSLFERSRRMLVVYGRVPFFYFLLHIAIVHLLALAISAARGGNWNWWVTEFPNGGVLAGHPPGYGYGLPLIWCIWIFVVALCYPACKWYAGVKRRSRNPLLTYL